MFERLHRLVRTLLVALVSLFVGGWAHALRPSDCQARNADSTCNDAVERSTDARSTAGRTLYSGPLAGVPETGYAYWGYNFLSVEDGITIDLGNLYDKDLFVNRSPNYVTVRLSFTIPTNHPCGSNCLPGVEFYVGAGWTTYFPPNQIEGDTLSLEYRVRPGESYGWIIGLWQATNPRLTVLVADGVSTSMQEVGLSDHPDVAQEIAAGSMMCICTDNSVQPCSKGSHFSNGLMGPWYRAGGDHYERAGRYHTCPFNN